MTTARAAAVSKPIIDEALIERLVRVFYGKARADDLLGPVFRDHVADWEPHLERICAFWSSVMLRSGRYAGRPVPAHVPLAIDADHFDRWLALFEETAREECPEAADLFIERARLIAQSLELALASHDGVLLPPGARYKRRAGSARCSAGRS